MCACVFLSFVCVGSRLWLPSKFSVRFSLDQDNVLGKNRSSKKQEEKQGVCADALVFVKFLLCCSVLGSSD